MIEPQNIPPHLIYEWAPLTRQDIADVLNDEERMPDAYSTTNDSISATNQAG